MLPSWFKQAGLIIIIVSITIIIIIIIINIIIMVMHDNGWIRRAARVD